MSARFLSLAAMSALVAVLGGCVASPYDDYGSRYGYGGTYLGADPYYHYGYRPYYGPYLGTHHFLYRVDPHRHFRKPHRHRDDDRHHRRRDRRDDDDGGRRADRPDRPPPVLPGGSDVRGGVDRHREPPQTAPRGDTVPRRTAPQETRVDRGTARLDRGGADVRVDRPAGTREREEDSRLRIRRGDLAAERN